MKEELEHFEIRCKKDGSIAEWEKDSSGCSDPACCGGPSYSIVIKCATCKATEQYYL